MQAKDEFITVEGLQDALKLKGRFGHAVAGILYKLFELDKLYKIDVAGKGKTGKAYADHVLQACGVKGDVPAHQLDYIPAEGGFITVSNHPYGSLDGLLLSSYIGERRPDMRILTTYLLTVIPGLRSTFIPVDNFSAGGARSISGIRTAMEHIAAGKPLCLFPAGEVATWHGHGYTEDIPWVENVIKMAKKSGFPIIPIYFDGQNTRSFHLLGKLHPRLRTARLIKEMINKPGTTIKMRIGRPIPPEEIADMEVPALARYLRNLTYALEAQCHEPAEKAATDAPKAPLAPEVPAEKVKAELAAWSSKLVFSFGNYETYILSATDAPAVMKELYRLRELTFRGVGEGTGKPEDTDGFDPYYKHLILWNTADSRIAGAYRYAYNKEVLASHGTKGLYTSSLFRYSEGSEALLSKCIELGRSFVVPDYQADLQPMRLLLAGLACATLQCPEAEYLTGPVSMSNDIPTFYRSLAMYFLQRDFSFPQSEGLISPTHPFKPDFLRVDPEGLQIPKADIDTADKLVAYISDGKLRLPTLIRTYFASGARLSCANVDPLFCDCLDGLIFSRLSDFPQLTCKFLFRGLPRELRDQVAEHFYGSAEL